MAKRAVAKANGVEQPESIDPQTYAAFIAQIDLQTIWLRSAQIQNAHGPDTPDKGAIRIQESAEWEPVPGGFRVLHHYHVRMDAEDETLLSIDATFGVDFASTEAMTDEIFDVFQHVNLPVNTWPYLREFVATTMGRMHWTPFTLPALKRGTRSASRRRSTSGKSISRTKSSISET